VKKWNGWPLFISILSCVWKHHWSGREQSRT
jgi:hypothetical protein